jgi:hypothetical protein
MDKQEQPGPMEQYTGLQQILIGKLLNEKTK